MQLRIAGACRIWYEPCDCYRYRLHEASVTHNRRTLEREWYEKTARLFAMQRRDAGLDDLELGRPPSPPEILDDTVKSAREHVWQLLIGLSWQHRRNGRYWTAIGTGLRACARRPMLLGVWKNLAALAIRRSA